MVGAISPLRWAVVALVILQIVALSLKQVSIESEFSEYVATRAGWGNIQFVWAFVVLIAAAAVVLLGRALRDKVRVNDALLLRLLLTTAGLGNLLGFFEVLQMTTLDASPASMGVGAIVLCAIGGLCLVIALLDVVFVKRTAGDAARAAVIAAPFTLVALTLPVTRALVHVFDSGELTWPAAEDRILESLLGESGPAKVAALQHGFYAPSLDHPLLIVALILTVLAGVGAVVLGFVRSRPLALGIAGALAVATLLGLIWFIVSITTVGSDADEVNRAAGTDSSSFDAVPVWGTFTPLAAALLLGALAFWVFRSSPTAAPRAGSGWGGQPAPTAQGGWPGQGASTAQPQWDQSAGQSSRPQTGGQPAQPQQWGQHPPQQGRWGQPQ